MKARAAPSGLLGRRQFGRSVRQRGEKQTAVSDSAVSERACLPAGVFGESLVRRVSCEQKESLSPDRELWVLATTSGPQLQADQGVWPGGI